MSKFIGVKMVEAVPMTASEAFNRGYRVSSDLNDDTRGYEVTYKDGYKSWCPADVFERSYYPIQDSNGEMLYRNDVEGFVDKVESIKIGTKTTNVTVTCLTGYEINAQSSCVKPENHNIEIGAEIAKPKAIDMIWAHLGFVLQWARNGLKPREEVLPPYVQRLVEEHKDVEQKLTKLAVFIDNSPSFKGLEIQEQERLKKQCVFMSEYFHILDERLRYAFEALGINK